MPPRRTAPGQAPRSPEEALLRVGFVTGVTPDKWARAWRERRGRDSLDLIPLPPESAEAALRAGEVDMCLLRLPIERVGLHVVSLYQELPVVVVSREHPAAAYDEISLADLAEEHFVLGRPVGLSAAQPPLDFGPMSLKDAVETAASGAGVAVVPMSVARLFQRKDAVAVPLTDAAETQIALGWLVDRDDDVTQEFVGVVRGRTARSSR